MTAPQPSRLRGLLALLGLVALVAGLPAVLLAIGADPIPDRTPTWDVLTRPDDGTLALTAITWLAWLAWLVLTVLVAMEVAGQLRGINARPLPGLGLPQTAVRGLVTTAAVLFAATAPAAAAHVATATPAQATRPAAVTAVAVPPPAADLAAPSAAASATVTHTVTDGESLWTIAERYLGAGARYPEIVELNRALLRDPTLILPGWQLTIPATGLAAGDPTRYTVQRGDTLSEIALDELGDATRYPEIAAASADIEQPGGVRLTNPDEIDVGWTVRIPGPTDHPGTRTKPAADTPAATPPVDPPPAVAAEPPAATPSATASTAATPTPAPTQHPAPAAAATADLAEEDADDEDSGWPVRTSYGVGALLAAGVVALIGTRRRAQQRRRRPGQQLPMPTGAAADLEQQLRVTADPLSVQAVDTALRHLAARCAATGQPLPVLRAARLTADQFDLYLAEPAELPAPWTGTADSTVWSLLVDDTEHLDDVDVTGVPAPYPALVTVGHDDEDGHVLLDLEYLGTLGVAGDPDRTREVLAALAVELATSTWADDLLVTVVGACPELEDALRTGRIRYLPSVGHLLDQLTARATQDRAALAEKHSPDLQHARVTGVAADAWPPEIVLLATPLTARQRHQIETVIDELPRVAVAAVTTGVTVGEWALDLDAGDNADSAVLAPIGLKLRPQQLRTDKYDLLLQVATLTEQDATPGGPPTAPEPTLEQVAAASAAGQAVLDEPADQSTNTADRSEDRPADTGADPAATAEPDTGDGAVAAAEAVSDLPDTPAASVAAPPADAPTVTESRTADTPPAAEQDEPPPTILVLGPVQLLGAQGPVGHDRSRKLTEYAAYLALHPGASHQDIADAIWPNRRDEDNQQTRHSATNRLRNWLGQTPTGEDYLPRHPHGGYALHPDLRSDVDMWDELLAEGPLSAGTEHLEQALALVRGRPFQNRTGRSYAWAERITQRLIGEIVDASYELARRRLDQGRWQAAEAAVSVGLSIEPGLERLWRMRILAAHQSRNAAAVTEAVDCLYAVSEDFDSDLEPETEALLAAVSDPGRTVDQLAHAL